MSAYHSPKKFQLKPQSKTRGREQLIMGSLLVLFALFNLYLASTDGLISLVFAVLFGWSGLRSISLGARLIGLPEKERGYRISTRGLYKVLNGQDLARLDLAQVKATWVNPKRDQLSLMTAHGVEVIKRSEFINFNEWPEFTTWLERSITDVIYRKDPQIWSELQQRSLVMSELESRKSRGTRLMMLALTIGAIIFFYQMNAHLLFFMQMGQSELIYELLGAPSGVSIGAGEITRLLSGLVLPSSGITWIFNLATLYWVGRHLERVWGTHRVLGLYLGGYLVGIAVYALFESQQVVCDAMGGSLAFIAASLMLKKTVNGDPNPLIKRASSNAFTFALVFLLVIALDPKLGMVDWSAWGLSIILGVVFAKRWMHLGQTSVWVLPQSSTQALWSALMSTSIPIASVLFTMTQPDPLTQLNSAQELVERYSPLSIAEFAQRCSGAPIQAIAELPTTLKQHLHAPSRCVTRERLMLRDALNILEATYPSIKPPPIKPRSSQTSSSESKSISTHHPHPDHQLLDQLRTSDQDTTPSTSPVGDSDLRIALDRARWLDKVTQPLIYSSFEARQTARDSLIQELIPLALYQPREIFGDLLASLITSSMSKVLEETKKDEVQVSTRKGLIKFNIKKGKLVWSHQTNDQTNESTEQSTKRKDSKEQDHLSDRYWLLVINQKDEVTHLVSVTINHQVEIPIKPIGHHIGDPKQTYRLVQVPQDLIPSNLEQASAKGKFIKLTHWLHSSSFTQWLNTADP